MRSSSTLVNSRPISVAAVPYNELVSKGVADNGTALHGTARHGTARQQPQSVTRTRNFLLERMS